MPLLYLDCIPHLFAENHEIVCLVACGAV